MMTDAAEILTPDDAAKRLAITPVALRARCRRAQRIERGQVVAPLGGGIVAFKFGSSWRVRFPGVASDAARGRPPSEESHG